MTQLLALARRAASILRSTTGAFDMMSVLAGAAVVAILVAGTVTNAFGVIPWAQDNGARQNLSSVSTAQGVAKVRDGKFLNDTGLKNASYLSGTPSMAVGADADGSCWVGLAKSDTGKVFYSTNDKADPQPFVGGTNPGCVAKPQLRNLAVAVGAPLPPVLAIGWGYNASGQLGAGTSISTNAPTNVVASGALAGKSLTAVSTGFSHSCGIADDKAFCWGNNGYGQLGTGSVTPSNVPVAVGTTGPLAGKRVTSISTAPDFTCAVADAKAYCWGENRFGQLGTGDVLRRTTPTAVLDSGVLAGKSVTSVSAGKDFACAVADSAAFCWGKGEWGKLGNGTNADSFVPVAVDMTGSLAGLKVSSISAASAHACVLAEGKAFCWGSNGNGVLGNGTKTDSLAPVAVTMSGGLAGKTFSQISSNNQHVCGVSDGSAYCWGWYGYGQTGVAWDGTYLPLKIGGLLAGKNVTSVSTGTFQSCAIADEKPYCWGDNTNGQLGNGTNTQSTSPVAVLLAGDLAGKTFIGLGTGSHSSLAIYE